MKEASGAMSEVARAFLLRFLSFCASLLSSLNFLTASKIVWHHRSGRQRWQTNIYGQHVMLLRTFVGRLCCVSLELLSPGGQWRGRHKGESLAELVRTPWVGPVGVGTLVAWLRFWNGSNVCD